MLSTHPSVVYTDPTKSKHNEILSCRRVSPAKNGLVPRLRLPFSVPVVYEKIGYSCIQQGDAAREASDKNKRELLMDCEPR